MSSSKLVSKPQQNKFIVTSSSVLHNYLIQYIYYFIKQPYIKKSALNVMFSTTWNKQWYLYSVKHVVPKVLSNALSSIRTFIKDCVQKIYRRISENNRPPVQQEHYRLLRLSGVD